MTTPTCKSCGAKFPGRDICKVCGEDPNIAPTVGQRIKRRLLKKKIPGTTVRQRAADRAYARSLRMPNGRPKKKHGRQVKVR